RAAEQARLALHTVRLTAETVQFRLKDRPALQGLRRQLLDVTLAGLRDVARTLDTADGIDHVTVWARLEMGDLCLESGSAADARGQYTLAKQVATTRGQNAPDDAEARVDLIAAQTRLGDALLRLGEVPAALGEFRSAVELARSSENRVHLSVAMGKLAD